MLGRLLRFLRAVLPQPLAAVVRRRRYRHAVSCPREDHAQIERLARRGHPVVEMKGPRPTWLHVECPCRCGSILRVNLMKTAHPVWTLSRDNSAQVSLSPSLNVPACGSHFWIVNGYVSWCDAL